MDARLIESLIAHETFERTYIPGEYQKGCFMGVRELSVHPDAVKKIIDIVIEQLQAELAKA